MIMITIIQHIQIRVRILTYIMQMAGSHQRRRQYSRRLLPM